MIHKQSKSLLIVFLPIMLALFSLGCNLSGLLAEEQAAAQLQFPPTRTPLPTFTPTPDGAGFIQVATIEPPPTLNEAATSTAPESTTGSGQTEASQEVVPTDTPTLVIPPTDTPLPQPTDTPTPSVPMATVKQDMNVRGGPGTNYPVVGSGSPGERTKITGRNQDGSWVQVEYPSADGRGWLYTPLVDVSGDISTMPVAQASMDPLPPPPEIAAPSEPPPAEQAAAPPPAKKYQFTPDAWHASQNAGIVHFKGRITDEHGNLINGFSVLLDNWSWKVLSHPSGASHWYPEKGPGEWDVVMPKLSTAQGWWWLSVVSYDCDFMGGFDSKCSQYTQLSEEVKVQVQSPDESIINANWICHWDCDKGVYFYSYTKDWGYGAPQ